MENYVHFNPMLVANIRQNKKTFNFPQGVNGVRERGGEGGGGEEEVKI